MASVTIAIAAPAARVWEVMSDIDRWHEWTPSISSIKRLGTGPFTVGSRALVRQPKLPTAIWKVTEIETGKSFTWVSGSPGLRVVASHRVEAEGAGSRATLSLELQGLLRGVFGWLMKGITARYLGFEARGLKARAEDPSFRHAGTNLSR